MPQIHLKIVIFDIMFIHVAIVLYQNGKICHWIYIIVSRTGIKIPDTFYFLSLNCYRDQILSGPNTRILHKDKRHDLLCSCLFIHDWLIILSQLASQYSTVCSYIRKYIDGTLYIELMKTSPILFLNCILVSGILTLVL